MADTGGPPVAILTGPEGLLQQGASDIAGDITGEAAGALPGSPDQSVPLPNPLSGIDRAGAVAEAFFKRLTDAAMWRSLGWIVLGLTLMIMGLRLWAGRTALPAPPSVVPVPV
jgi:hypothetical protein